MVRKRTFNVKLSGAVRRPLERQVRPVVLAHLQGEISDACGYDKVCLRLVVPVPHRTIAVTQEEVPVYISSYDARLLLAPPMCIQRPPIRLPKEQSDFYQPAVGERDGAVPKEFLPRGLKGVTLAHRIERNVSRRPCGISWMGRDILDTAST